MEIVKTNGERRWLEVMSVAYACRRISSVPIMLEFAFAGEDDGGENEILELVVSRELRPPWLWSSAASAGTEGDNKIGDTVSLTPTLSWLSESGPLEERKKGARSAESVR